jgi:RNA polymerase sigma-70 factor (ECF subfamily)
LENTLAGSHQGPNEEIYGDEVNHVRACLETLDSGQRAAVDLAFYGGLTHTEIATHTGSPLGTIKARIRRALLQLKSCVENKLNL